MVHQVGLHTGVNSRGHGVQQVQIVDLPRFDVLDYGAVSDPDVDDTAAVNAALAAWIASDGGEIVFADYHRIDGQLLIPNDDETLPTQPSLIFRGLGMSGNTNNGGGSAPQGGTILDMRYDGDDAKIVTLGGGTMEITGISFKLDGELPLLLTTNTTLHVHHNAFHGDPDNSGTECNQDVIILGGVTEDFDGDTDSSFQGYGTVISDNHFERIRRAVYGKTHVNSVVIENNVIWQSCGSNLADGAAFEFAGPSGSVHDSGNIVWGNTIEVINYPYAVKVTNASKNTFGPNGIWDATATHLAAYRFEARGEYNHVIDGYRDDAYPLISEDSTVAGLNTAMTTHQSGETRWAQPWTFLRDIKRVNSNPLINTDSIILEDSTGNQWQTSFPVIGASFPAYHYYYTPDGGSREDIARFERVSSTLNRMWLYGSSETQIRSLSAQLRVLAADGQPLWLGDGLNMAHILNGVIVATYGIVNQTGATGARPASPVTGQQFFDTTLGQPIWYDGSGWVDATGTTA